MSSLPPNLKVTADNTAAFAEAIKKLGTLRVMVGVPQEKGARKPDPVTGKIPDISNAVLAYIHDNGSPEANIAAREFLRPGIRTIQGEIVKRFFNIGRDAFNGRAVAAVKGFHAVGLIAVSAVRKKILDGPFAPLAEATLRAFVTKMRRRSDYGPPLNVTGQLRNSITYVIREEGEEDKDDDTTDT